MHSAGFPNLFIISQTQGGFTVNYPHMLNELAKHVAYILGQSTEQDATRIEVTDEAEAEWVATIIDKARDAQAFLQSCTPGYYNNEGRPGDRSNQNTSYGAGNLAFFKVLEQWRESGECEGLSIT